MAEEKEDGLKLFTANEEAKSPEAAKFISEGEGKNGISPISVDHLKAKFTGLTKEELMKFANDPFWVRLRWFLFISFWLIWLLMLFAAIFIIVGTPKCQEPAPLVWWERSALYVLDVKKLVPPQSPEAVVIEMLKSKIDYMKQELDIESLLLKSVMDSERGSSDEVTNFTNVDRCLNSLDSFHHDVIDYAKSRGVHILLGFSPEYSGSKMDQFIRSEVKEEGFKDFYVWYPQNYSSKPDKLPNNWLSVYDTPAWEWDDKRKQFYLHQFNVSQPDLNYRNPVVLEFMSNVLKFWLKLGIEGFFLDKTEYLLENDDFKDEVVGQGNEGFNLEQYKFYSHVKTFELPDNVKILEGWSDIIRNASGIISVSGGILDHKNIADFVLRPLTLNENFTAKDLNASIMRWNNAVSHPTWEWKCSSNSLKCMTESDLNSLIVVSFLLPGVPIIHDSDDFKVSNGTSASLEKKMSVDTSTNGPSAAQSRPRLIKKLTELRATPAFSFGDFKTFIVNGSVFAYTRIKSGNPGYLVAWNLSYENVTVNFPNYISTVPEDLTIVVKSDLSSKDVYESKNKVSSAAVIIPRKSAVVFSFVPSLK